MYWCIVVAKLDYRNLSKSEYPPKLKRVKNSYIIYCNLCTWSIELTKYFVWEFVKLLQGKNDNKLSRDEVNNCWNKLIAFD